MRRSLSSAGARDFADVPYNALWVALTLRQIFAQHTVFDLLALLGLVADPDRKPWWSEIPGAVYAMHAADIDDVLRRAEPPAGSWREPDRDPVFACTDAGVGVWAQDRARWLVNPTLYFRPTLNQLVSHLLADGWDAGPTSRPDDARRSASGPAATLSRPRSR